jgi:hypothetical protein
MIGSFTTPARIVTIYFIMSTPNTHITSPRVSWPSIPTLESRLMKNYWSHYNLGSGLSQHISDPFLFNIDEDEFHSCRYMYILSRPVTNFGIGKDIAPIVPKKKFCSISVDEAASGRRITLTSNEGGIFVNGTHMEAYEAVPLTPGNRVVFGGSIVVLHDPAGGHAIIDAT